MRLIYKRVKDNLFLFLCGCFLLFGLSKADVVDSFDKGSTDSPRLQILFDSDWSFHRGSLEHAEIPGFDASGWQRIDLPHDWSIENIPGTDSPYDPQSVGAINTGYAVGGTGWYHKMFTVSSRLRNKRFHLQFDGIYMNANIWLNGKHLGNHPYGYTTFSYDITDKLEFGQENILAVEVKNEGRNSRWYSGSGIYRHAWLTVLEPIHVAHWGTYITTPQVTDSSARVKVATSLVNTTPKSSEVIVQTTVLNSKGAQVAKTQTNLTLQANQTFESVQEMNVKLPDLWSPDSPSLYTAVTEVYKNNDTVKADLLDKVETIFGIRTIEFSIEKGFLLNGKPILLKGGCMHHDNGPLGAAAYDRAEQRRVELMKASGFNAIRCAHNPPSPAFLDACDRIGVLVIDEAFDMWRKQKNPEDYHLYFDDWWKKDVESMVLRDRNHPSIIMWSTGNEIPERGEQEGVQTSKMLGDYIKKIDPTRPITSAVNGLSPDKDPYFATLDLAGYNYSFGGDHGKKSIFEIDHKRIPDRIMYCSESYPLEAFGAWMDVLDHTYVFGDFVWTGFDYLGESSIGWRGYLHEGSFYPWTHAFCGDIDICGFKRPQSYYRDVLWKSGQRISVFVKPPQPSFEINPNRKDWSKWHWHDVVACWNWPGYEEQLLEVEVYSACQQAELYLNGKSLGKKETNRDTEYIARWQVPYKPGELKVIGFNDSKQAASCQLRTAEEPVKIKLSADRTSIKSDGQDLSYITVELLDANDVRHPKAENLIKLEIQGPGSILSVGSSNPMSTESFKNPQRKAYQGRCLVIVKADSKAGLVKLKAVSEGLKSDTITITTGD